MNKTNCLALAAFIEQMPDSKFNIANYDTCICGAAERLVGPSHLGLRYFLDIERSETSDQFHALTYPEGYYENPPQYSKAQAVKTLRHLAETGEVNWSA